MCSMVLAGCNMTVLLKLKIGHQVSFGSQGTMKFIERDSEFTCDTSGELKLRQALT